MESAFAAARQELLRTCASTKTPTYCCGFDRPAFTGRGRGRYGHSGRGGRAGGRGSRIIRSRSTSTDLVRISYPLIHTTTTVICGKEVPWRGYYDSDALDMDEFYHPQLTQGLHEYKKKEVKEPSYDLEVLLRAANG